MQILDLLDCTGSGDVATSQVVKADDEGCILGIHGNKLKLNPEWKNPTGAPSRPPHCTPALHAPQQASEHAQDMQICSLNTRQDVTLAEKTSRRGRGCAY